MTCEEAAAVLRARPVFSRSSRSNVPSVYMWDLSLAAFSLMKTLRAGGLDQVLLDTHKCSPSPVAVVRAFQVWPIRRTAW